MDVDEQVAALLIAPPADHISRFFAQSTAALGVAVRPDVGVGKGKGVCATRAFAAGELLFQEPPLVAIQHTHNRERAWVCAHCFRFVGSIEEQLARASALHGTAGASTAAGPSTVASLSERLPCSQAEALPPAVPCPGRCSDVTFCSQACADAAWKRHHSLLCPANAASQQQLLEFYDHADHTNDVFRLAAQVIAATMSGAARHLDGDIGSANAAQLWAALQRGWEPFSMGHKALWWDCVALPDDVDDEAEFRGDLHQLAADSLELLTAALRALRPDLCSAFPAALDLRLWGAVVGMFELNNLSLFVAGPVPRWAQAADDLPHEQRAVADAAAAAFGGLDGILDEEDAWACEGNAFYSLQACVNHSCVPNAHAFKREGDLDGAAVILALRAIPAGEEITISYIDEGAPLEERAAALRDYGFSCDCDKCAAEGLAEELQLE